MEEILNKLIDIVQKAAPELWAIALRQNLVYVVQDTVTFILLILIGIFFYKKFLSRLVEYHDGYRGSDRDKVEEKNPGMIYIEDAYCSMVKFFGWFGLILIAVGIFGTFSMILSRIINPNYYALQTLLGMIK